MPRQTTTGRGLPKSRPTRPSSRLSAHEGLRCAAGLPGASPEAPVAPPPFFNLTIGGVYRDTPDRTAGQFTNVSRGYVTHATAKDKEVVADIFNRLGVDVEPRQVDVSPLRSKVFLQHLLSLFKPGVVVAHAPTYASTTDAARNTSGHEVVSIPATDASRFKQGRKRVIQRRFNEGVLEAIPKRKASTL